MSNIGQGHWVKVPAKPGHEVKHYARFSGCRLIFEEIPNINIKCVKVTVVHNIGQGHQVKVPVESVHREEVLYKVW